jgi:FAD:protein FMN transferase
MAVNQHSPDAIDYVGLVGDWPGAAGVDAAPLRRLRFHAMGTACEVQYACDQDALAGAFNAEAHDWVARFEARCTRFRSDSVVGRINAAAGTGEWIEIDEEMSRFLDVCDFLHSMTNGVLDATSAPLARLWDYKAARPRVPTTDEVAAARRLVGWTRVERQSGAVRLPERGMELDFGGWGKEFAVDRVTEIARLYGFSAALVDFGHDIAAFGTPPGRPAWHIGLEDPERPGALSGSIAVLNRAVASSGDYLRGFTVDGRRYGHILDPRTGRPADRGCRQVTVVAPTCLQAGVLSTTAFILGAKEGLRLVQDTMGAEARIVADGAVSQTRGFFHYVVA